MLQELSFGTDGPLGSYLEFAYMWLILALTGSLDCDNIGSGFITLSCSRYKIYFRSPRNKQKNNRRLQAGMLFDEILTFSWRCSHVLSV